MVIRIRMLLIVMLAIAALLPARSNAQTHSSAAVGQATVRVRTLFRIGSFRVADGTTCTSYPEASLRKLAG